MGYSFDPQYIVVCCGGIKTMQLGENEQLKTVKPTAPPWRAAL
jgi:hypothetical protein